MLDIKSSADYLSRSGTFTNFSMLFAGEYLFLIVNFISVYLKNGSQIVQIIGYFDGVFVIKVPCCVVFTIAF